MLFQTIVFWAFHSIATSSFDRISPGSKRFIGSGFGLIVFLSAVRRVSLTVPKHLDFVPPSLRPM